jgi:subtilisin family serine protease
MLLNAGIFAANAANAQVTNVSIAYGLGSGTCPKCGHRYSLSTPSVRSFILDRSVNAQSKRSLIVSSTGNDGNKKAIAYPAACPDAIPVAAVNAKKHIAPFSNEDRTKSLHTAPGRYGQPGSAPTEYVGTDAQTNAKFAGTSMASAYATGVIALLIEQAERDNQPFITVKDSLGELITF